MDCHDSQGRLRGKIGRAAANLVEESGAGLRELLPPKMVAKAIEREGIRYRDCLFTPLVTIWVFLLQELSADGSCRAAVAGLLALLAAKGDAAPADADGADPETGPYCKARKRLLGRLVSRLTKDTGAQLHERYPSGLLLGGREVKIADGTTVSMPDTPANQAEWPQPPTQKAGLGFPMVRMVAILSMNSAAVLDLAIGPYKGKKTGETALLRTIMGSLKQGDVLLADRYYASYCMIALLLARGVDSLFRQHQTRKIDFRSGRSLGHDDHLITMTRPVQPPDWMDKAQYAQMPETLEVREVRFQVERRGFRVKTVTLVTTLVDEQVYCKRELAKAFRCRWHVELDLRAIKQTMNMSVLRCKTPQMVSYPS